MARTITISRRYSIILASLNAWTLAGGGLLITLGGNPILGPLLIAAGLLILGMAIAGRLQRQQAMPLAQSVVVLLAIPIMFFSLLLIGGGLIPARFNVLWYGFLAVFAVLAVIACLELARSAASGKTVG